MQVTHRSRLVGSTWDRSSAEESCPQVLGWFGGVRRHGNEYDGWGPPRPATSDARGPYIGDVQVFELAFQPTISDYELAVRAKRRATRALWLDRGVGTLMVLVATPAIFQGYLSSIPLGLFGLGAATGLNGRAHRWLFTYRRQPSMFLPTHFTVDDRGMRERDGQVDTFVDWSRYKALLHLDDRLILMTATGGNCGITGLPRRALDDASQWPAFVKLAEAHVPDHPAGPPSSRQP